MACGALVAGADRETEAAPARVRRPSSACSSRSSTTCSTPPAPTSALGKRAGADARRGKRTHVTVLGLERARALAAETRERALARLAAVPAATDDLRALCDAVADRSA